MGSSKKHKDKDRSREKDRESRKRHRSRSKERSHRGGREHRDHGGRRTYQENEYEPPPSKLALKEEHDFPPEQPTQSKSESSLSIEETNKLRERLGLKPLQVSGGEAAGSSQSQEYSKREDVHRPPENLKDQAYVQKLREKIAMQKEKRKIQDKLRNVKTLGESDSDEEGAANWVKKSRKIEADKQQAEKMAKLLEDMDQEFGIGNLVEEQFRKDTSKTYTSRDLRGLKVEHSRDRFEDERAVILTLKDKGILDEDAEDVLVNVNIVDDERSAKNNIVKKKKPGYTAYEDEELDQYGVPVKPDLLSKYDEEISGEKKNSFVLGAAHEAARQREIHRNRNIGLVQEKKKESLVLPMPKIASEYFTEEEMVKFKKPKKMRRVKKARLRADDLIPLLGDDGDNDRTYRAPKRSAPTPSSGLSLYFRRQELDSGATGEGDDEEPDVIMPDEDLSAVVIEPDEAELELQMALTKARKLKQKEGGGDKLADMVKTKVKREPEEDSASRVSGISMNSTAEFCRALGDIPTYGQAGNRDEEADELMDLERELLEERQRLEEEKEKKSAWNEVDMDEDPAERVKDDAPILDEEPDIGSGIGGALQLAMKKGYLEKDMKKLNSAPRHSQLEAANYTIEDKARFEEERAGRRERYNGPVTDFREKDTYKPDVKLEYIDDSGRLLNQKEAFRYLSHKFHGKGPGKNKVEKRMKKVQEEALMKRMSSTDTPLGTLALLQEKQKQSQSPFILLSGGSKALTLPSIAKQP